MESSNSRINLISLFASSIPIQNDFEVISIIKLKEIITEKVKVKKIMLNEIASKVKTTKLKKKVNLTNCLKVIRIYLKYYLFIRLKKLRFTHRLECVGICIAHYAIAKPNKQWNSQQPFIMPSLPRSQKNIPSVSEETLTYSPILGRKYLIDVTIIHLNYLVFFFLNPLFT